MRRFFEIFPTMVLPIALYAVIAMLMGGSKGTDIFINNLEHPAFYMRLLSGATWGVSGGTLLVLFGLCVMFYESIRGNANNPYAIIHHTLSVFLTLGSLAAFMALDSFATSTFFLLLVMCAFDMISGVIVNIADASFRFRD